MEIPEFIKELQKKPEIILKKYDLPYMKEIVLNIGKAISPKREFKIDADNEQQINEMITYFMGNPEFEKEGKSLYSGLMLRGNVGTGKSLLMRIFSGKEKLDFTKDRSFKTVSCLKIYSDFVEQGYSSLEKYCHFNTLDEEPLKSSCFCFDEFGEEPEPANHYGSPLNVMEYILLRRYDNWQDHFQITHLTTNKTPREIEDKYGERIRSRIGEMCNDFIFAGKDRR